MSENKKVTIGTIRGVHGLHGNLKVISYAESDSLYKKGSSLIVKYPDGLLEDHVVEKVSLYKKGFLVRLSGVDNISKAEKMKGADIQVPREALPEIDPEEDGDTWYWVDLIGSNVNTVEGKFIGKLKSIFRTGSNDVYVVGEGKNEILVPAIDHVIISVDVEAGNVVVDLPEGL